MNNEYTVANMKLQMALQEQTYTSGPVVPNLVSQVKTTRCGCPRTQRTVIQPPPNRCCPYSSPTDLEIKAQEVAAYNQYAPKNNCCWRIG